MMNYMEELRQRLKALDSPIKPPPRPAKGLVKPPVRNLNLNSLKEKPRENKYPFADM